MTKLAALHPSRKILQCCVLLAVFLCAVPAVVPAQDPSGAGPYTIGSGTYRFASQTVSGIPYPVDVTGKVWTPFPTDQAPPYPLVLFLHGNHGICRVTGTTTDICIANPSGPCPTGTSPTLNHEGYDYIAGQLASWGYVVVSISANNINCRNDGIPERGRLVMEHLRRWSQWTSTPSDPFQGTPFFGAVDITTVGLMGHSRGGEGVRAAAQFNRDAGYPYGVLAVYEIGPVDFHATNANDEIWSVLLPGCDGDVSDNQGMRPFDRAQLLTETFFPAAKAQQFVWGTNHNFYNTVWSQSDCIGCCVGQTPISAANQRQVGLVYVMGFFRTFLGGEDFFNLFSADAPPPPSVTTIVDNAYTDSAVNLYLIDDFRTAGAPTANSAGGTNNWTNITITACGGASCVSGAPSGSAWRHDASKRAARISWTSQSPTPRFEARFPASDVSFFGTLTLRVAEQNSNLNPAHPQVQNFRVRLKDATGTASTLVPIVSFAGSGVHVPVGSQRDTINNRKSVLKSVRIPLSALGGVDLTQIVGVELLFDQRATGALLLSDIAFGF